MLNEPKKPDEPSSLLISLVVRSMRLELIRPNEHYPLKVACLPIPPRPLLNVVVRFTTAEVYQKFIKLSIPVSEKLGAAERT